MNRRDFIRNTECLVGGLSGKSYAVATGPGSLTEMEGDFENPGLDFLWPDPGIPRFPRGPINTPCTRVRLRSNERNLLFSMRTIRLLIVCIVSTILVPSSAADAPAETLAIVN